MLCLIQYLLIHCINFYACRFDPKSCPTNESELPEFASLGNYELESVNEIKCVLLKYRNKDNEKKCSYRRMLYEARKNGAVHAGDMLTKVRQCLFHILY